MNVISFNQAKSNRLGFAINASVFVLLLGVTVKFWPELETAMVFGLTWGMLCCGLAAVMLFRNRRITDGSYSISVAPNGITIESEKTIFLSSSEIVECRVKEVEKDYRGDTDHSYTGFIQLRSGSRILLPIQPTDQARFRLFKKYCQANSYQFVEEKTPSDS
jgi:hypothetical protein